MSNYAVGDIQGCLKPLQRLLREAHFQPEKDTLWAAGDLVNRGPESLETLRFLKSLPNVIPVLGNHDLHLLAAARGYKSLSGKDTLAPILQAPDRDELLNWLQQQPLAHYDASLGYIMVHAGIPPIWTRENALTYANEVESTLRSTSADHFFKNMYGNIPVQWEDTLIGTDRLRIITNYFTRMRFCNAKGALELSTKTNVAPPGFDAWFRFKGHQCQNERILFGHWASLQGNTGIDKVIALDTGCVWGGRLTMLRLEDQRVFSTHSDSAA